MRYLYKILATIFCMAFGVSSFAQITVTFTGRDSTNQYHIPLDHVTVFDLDQLWEEVLYYPDTTLILGTVGIDDYGCISNIQLMQNVPNPFDGTTEFALLLPEDRDVLLEIYDITGRLAVGQHFSALSAGTHLFQATLTSPQTYLLSAKVDNGQMTIKMVNEGHGAGNTIRHLGMTDAKGDFTLYLNDEKAANGYPFKLGDEMKYTGYAMIDEIMRESKTIVKSQNSSETIPLKFDLSAPKVNTVVSNSITATTATCGVQLVSDGGSAITALGICWSTSPNPTINNDTINGVTSTITGLSPNTTYHVRAYATNSVGTAYGADEAFTTLCDIVNISITGNTIIYYGQPAILIASGANSYLWSTGDTVDSITVNPPTSTTYTVTGTNSYGCTATASVTVTVNFLPPTVITGTVDSITATAAICGGNVVSTGGATVTERGVCWSTLPNPMISGNHLPVGSGTGSFDGAITGLTPNTTYHARAYAINSVDTAYGADSTFTTLCDDVNVNITGNSNIYYGQSTTLTASGANSYVWDDGSTTTAINVSPTATNTYTVTGTNIYGCSATASVTVTVTPITPTVTTTNISNILSTSANCGGTVTDNGGAEVTERGICWSTDLNPAVNGNHLPLGSGMGSFNATITNLSPNTTYHVRAYAINSAGPAYGADSTFTTPCDIVTVNITGNTNIYYGQSDTLTASGANSYVWDDGSITAAINVSPTANTTYNVTGTNIYGCTATASVTVTVNPVIPTVTTNNISNITPTSANCGGTVTDNGGAEVTERGFCWGPNLNPQVSGSHLSVGNGMGSFNDLITGLTPNTTYHVRAYATNIAGTAYGADSTFTTLCDEVNVIIAGNTSIDYEQNTTLTASGANSYQWSTGDTTESITASPTVTTTYTVTGTNSYGCSATASVTITVNYLAPTVTTEVVNDITPTSANCGGNVISDGGKTVTARGICWSTSPNPDVYGSHIFMGSGTGSFSTTVNNLTPNTTYHVRAYAINSVDTAYGADSTFTTLCNTVNVSISGTTTINYGDSTTLTASGANSYVWNNGSTTVAITVRPTTTTTYTVMGTNSYACTATASVTVTVNNLAPRVITNNDVNDITSISATCGGTVASDGGAMVTARGVCWSTSPNPTVDGCCVTNDGSGMGTFTSYITELAPGTTYYVRAYAINSEGTSYGEPRTFTTHTTPTVTTATVTDVTGHTAICGGTVTGDGGTSVTVRGVCWSISENPTINDSHTNDGNGVGSFTSNITGLSEGITYHVRAYATNNVGTSYGADITFTTPLLPTVITDSISNITDSTAICGGVVVSDGGATVTARGVCWSSLPNPTVNDFHTIDGGGTGSFNSSLQGLTAGTMYYVRAYATSVAGTAYGQQVVFTTTIPDGAPCIGIPTVTDIDGNIYNTVKIGEQCWMKENLKTTRYANGVNISKGSSTSTTTAYRYYPYNDSANVSIYGFLYNWYATVHGYVGSSENPSGIQGVCPTGWHVPSNAEWAQLANYMSGLSQYWCGDTSANKAKALASSTGWNSSTNTCAIGNNQSTNNATNFSALPAGTYYDFYDNPGQTALFWSATESSINSAKTCYLVYNSAKVIRGDAYMSNGYSVRCLRDSVPGGAPSNISCQTAKIIPVVYNGTTEPYCPTYGNLTLTVVDSVTGNSIPNLTYTWAGESVNVFSTDSTSFVMIIPEWCDTVYNAFVTVNDSQGCVKTVSRTIDVASSGPIFIGTLADTTVPRQSGCKCFIPDFRDLITNSILTDDCFTLSNIKSTSFWYAQSPQAGTELTEESQVVSITITNPCGKSNTITVNVHKSADLPAIVLTSTPDHFCAPTFEKAGDGTITVIAPTSGSGHTYTYKVFDANDNELSLLYDFPTNLTCYWLSHQTYRVQAYEAASGCSVSDTITVGHNPYSVDFSFIITPNTDCSSATGNGSITVTNPTSTNPNPDFTYSIDNVHYSTNPVFTDLADGTYSVYVKDAASACVAERLAGIGLVDTIPPTISIDIPIRLYPVLGYDYSWNSPDSMTFVNAIVPYISDNCTDLSSLINSLEFLWENTTESPIGANDIFHNANHRTITAKVTDDSGNSTETIVFFMDFPDAVPCPGTPTVTDIDGNTYNTVRIGRQCWMKENLRTTKYADGTSIPAGSSTSYTSPYYYDYSASSIPLAERGYLYNWPAVMHGASSSSANPSGVQGICPNGWHVPSNAEWMQLTNYVSSQSSYVCGDTSINNAKALAATTEWRTDITACAIGNNLAANNATNFSALPAAQPVFHYTAAEYWSATEENSDSTFVNFLMLSFNSERAHLFATEKSVYQSVRCLRDEAAVIDEKSCPNAPTVTDHEGNVYATVQIGDQCWMRDNLRTTTSPSTGTYLISTAGTGSTYTGKQARWYNDDSTTYAPMNYGLLYNWNAAVDTFNTAYGETSVDTSSSNAVSVNFTGYRRGICPIGWHIPSNVEWTQLTNYVSSQSEYVCGNDSTNIAKALASTIDWSTYRGTCCVGNNLNTNNATGFGTLPAGYYGKGGYHGSSEGANFWSSMEASSGYAWSRCIDYNSADVNRGIYYEYGGCSVRCLRDETSTAALPTVTTDMVTTVSSTSATCGGNVTSDGGANVIARGVCWSTSQNPTIEDAHTIDSVGTGNFTSNLTGLTPNTTYYVRAYATNSAGIAYGEEVSFTTTSAIPAGDGQPCPGAPTVTDVDGNVYNTVKIGAQCWMKENLRTTKYADGTAIPAGGDQWSLSSPFYYDYSSSSIPLEGRGYLYNWSAVMHGTSSNSSNPIHVQGVCPTGWHIPSDVEWTELEDYAGSQSQFLCGNDNTRIAKALAATTNWGSWSDYCVVGNDLSANNNTGFSALPAGRWEVGWNYINTGYIAQFWSSIDTSYLDALNYYIYDTDSRMNRSFVEKSSGISVRCLRDSAVDGLQPILPIVTTDSVTLINSVFAYSSGNVISGGGGIVTDRGVCWSTGQNPTINDNHLASGRGGGSFTTIITGLSPATTYYVRAYATNEAGTAYGEQLMFTTSVPEDTSCPGTVTDIDGNTYTTVKIGGQCWMRENLRTTRYADSSFISYANGNSSNSIGYWCYPNNDSTNKQAYGLLYNWPAVMHGMASSDATPSGVQGICPDGWHVPSGAEWHQLTDYVSSQSQYWCDGNSYQIAKALASPIGWGSCNSTCSVCNQSPNNATGFCAMPAGYDYWGFGTGTSFRSSTAVSSSHSKTLWIGKNSSWVEHSVSGCDKSYSVRCLHDEDQSHYFPTVSTEPVTNISSISAVCGGNVTSDNGSAVTVRGVCWSIFHNPTVSDAHSKDGAGEGSFTSAVLNLSPNNTYYVRAYATNSYGTVYGNEVSFTTPLDPNGDDLSCPNSPVLIDVEGNIYNTVQIGNQCWMRENLRTTKYADGTSIACGSYDYSSSIGYWWYTANDSSLKSTYGLQYSWPAVVNGSQSNGTNPNGVQGVCPTGWHVPSPTEWGQLVEYVSSQSQYWCEGDSNKIAKALASTSGWYDSGDIGYTCVVNYMPGNNNATGFGALPAGYSGDISADNFADDVFYWSSEQDDYNMAFCWEINSYQEGFNNPYTLYRSGKGHGHSVRCLRDETSTVIIDEKSCPNTPTVTDHEGNVYATVQIGDQCWMRENLRATKYSDDTIILQGGDTSSVIGYWYYPNNYESNKFTYGLLYNWKAVMRNTLSSNSNQSGVQGVCPNGWHVPSHAEYLQLIDYLGSQNQYFCGNAPTSIAKALASTTGWNSSTYFCVVGNNQSSNNTTGFSAFPAGEYKGDEYANFGKGTRLWSTTECTSKRPYFLRIWYHNDNVIEPADHMYFAFSVRCIRDESYTLPTITTTAVSGVSYNTATCGGTITSIGSETVTARGTCWSKSHYPTIHDDHSLDGSGSGSFTSQLINLTPMTTYYVRAYAASNAGTAYGDVKSFVTKANSVPTDDAHPCAATPIVIDVDNNVYNTVQLGGQCWMAENLRTTKFPDGTSIEYGLSNSSTIPYLYYPDGNVANVLTYGYLYNWSAVMYGSSSSNVTNGGVQGICPEGWHVPSNAEWTQLINYVSSQSQYVCDSDNTCNAKALASITGWYSSSLACAVGNTLCANNVTGFGALPAGYYSGGYYNSGYSAYFWSATGNSSNDAWHCSLYSGSTDVSYSYYDKSHGFSVRCLCDEIPPEAPTVSSLPYSTNFYDDTIWTLNNGTCGNYWATNSTYGLFVTNNGTTPGYNETSPSTVMAEKLLLMPSSDSIHIEFDVRVGGESSYDYLKVFLSPSSTTYTAGTSHNTQSDKSYSTYAVNFSSFKFQTGNSSNPYTFNLTNGTTVHISVNMVNPNPNDTAKLVFLWRDDTSVSTQPGAVVSQLSVSEVTTAVIDEKSCPNTPTVTDHEGNVYATVQIGDQCWMRDNLRTTTSPSTGTYLIPPAGTSYTYTGKQARWYNDDSTTYAPMNYGLLYNWNASVDTFNTAYGETNVNTSSSNAVPVTFTGHRRGICPAGWHLPSDAEWTQLTNYVSNQSEYLCGGNNSYIGKALADSIGWNSSTNICVVGNNPSTNNATGFGALPVGFHLGTYGGGGANFWSATEASSVDSWVRTLIYNNAKVYRGNSGKGTGYSVRCLRDEDCSPNISEFSITSCGEYTWNGLSYTQSGDYTQTFLNAMGCDSVVTMHLTVNEDPQFQLTATENVICVGGTTVITAESTGWNNADVNYEWTSTEMGASFSFSGSEYTFTAEAAGVFTFNVTAFETTSGCMATDDITITVNADPATSIVTVDNAVVCDGSHVTLTVTNTNANATYIWEKNGVVIPGANGAVIYDSPMSIDGDLTNYIYTVIAELPMSGCTSTASSNTVVTAIPIPSAIVSVEGNTTVCAGGSTMLHANITPVSTNYTYQWYKDNVLIVGATEADYIASEFARETAYNFQVVATANPGCHVTAYAPPITFVANPHVEATVSNNITCIGGTATLTAIVNGGVADVDGYTFEWYRDNAQLVGNDPEYVTSANDNVGNYTYWITVISNYGCQSTSNIINHNVVADPIVTISVASGYPTTVCNGGASMLKANVTGGYGNITYQWYKNGDILAGETNQHLALNNLFYGASDTYTVEATQTGAGCSNSASVALDTLVTVAPNYTVNVSGYGNVCEGGTLTLNATVNGVINGDVLSYNWYRVFNGTSTLINDANAAQYQTSDFMLGDYNEYYVVAVSSISGCSTVSNSVPCNVVSNPTIVIQGPHTICEGGNLTLNAFVSGGVEGVGYTYTWDWTGAATGTATTTVPTYSVNLTAIDAAATYYFTVTITRNDNTGCTATSNAFEVNVIPVPTVSVTADNAYVCQNGNVTLTAHVSPNGAYNYVWTIDGEQQVVNAATVTTYMVTTSAINATVAVSAASTSATCSATSSITVPIVTTVTDIDGNTYNTIQIGGQCWMKENLRTTKFADGTFIEEGSSTSSTIPYRFIPDDNASNVPTYGYLYNWAAVMHGASSNDETPSGIQGICPDGWHLPSDAEWSQLTDYVSSQSQYWCDNNSNNIAKALSSTTGWFTTTTNCDVGNDQSSNNATGFNALPAGYATYGSGDFNSKAYLWSTTLSPIMGLGYFSINFYSSAPDCDFACDFCSYSVRCLHDDCFLQYFPTVSTSDVVNVTSSTATCGGNVISTENVTVNTRGVCWSILHNPTIKDDHTIDGSGAGSFTSSITGLKSNFTYYIRAYATNSFGTVYGNEVSVIIPVNSNGDAFSCPGTPTVSDDDGNVYNTVQIGGQCWMRENLRTTKYPDGTTIPQGDITTMSTTGGWYYPNEDSSYRYNYGLLYNWSAVMNGSSSIDSIPSGVQGICPAGWHVPSNLEWIQLTNYLHSQSQYWCNNDSDNIAKSLAAPGRWLTNKWLLDTCYVCNNPHNNNSTGFGALPAGTTNIYGKGFCSDAYFWSATEDAGNNIHVFRIVGTFASEWLSSTSKYYGSSVRCLRDENTTDGQPCPGTPTVTDIDGNVYNTVKVGEQCWMKENLRTTRYADGTEIYQGVNSSSSIGYWYYPNNDATNKFTYGLLYNWSAVMNGASPSYAIPSGVQGICPIGWHVPSNAEWTNLTDYVRSQSQYRCDNTNSYIAKALSSKLGWVICTTYNCAVGNNPSSNNITGFSVLPAGFYSETFNGIGYSTYFWSSTEASEEKVKGRCIFNVDALVYSGSIADINKSHGFSVRCLRD